MCSISPSHSYSRSRPRASFVCGCVSVPPGACQSWRLRVLVWRRGEANSKRPVVVVANFSDFTSDHANTPQGEYVVHNWPATPAGGQWKEITQDRIVPPEWVGR